MRILVCPLNWGLGHATRCVPIIRNYINQGHEVIIASDGYPLVFLKLRFPQLEFVELESYKFQYSPGNSQVYAMLRALPSIIYGIYFEHKWLQKFAKLRNIDVVVSDNRFGLWSGQVHSIYITHQLMIKMPRKLKWLEPIAWFIHRRIIHRYNECLIPDDDGKDALSGDLSHKYPLPENGRFIGFLSRFDEFNAILPDVNFDVLVVISGPEPHCTLFKEEIIKKYSEATERIIVVGGKPGEQVNTFLAPNIWYVSHLSDSEFVALVKGVKKIVSRPGYTSIMDYKVLKCVQKVNFVPTPGQTEQEYLCSLHCSDI